MLYAIRHRVGAGFNQHPKSQGERRLIYTRAATLLKDYLSRLYMVDGFDDIMCLIILIA